MNTHKEKFLYQIEMSEPDKQAILTMLKTNHSSYFEGCQPFERIKFERIKKELRYALVRDEMPILDAFLLGALCAFCVLFEPGISDALKTGFALAAPEFNRLSKKLGGLGKRQK